MHEIQQEQEKNIFISNVRHYIKVHRDIHGSGFKWEDVHKDFMGSFPEFDAMEVMDEIERQEKVGPILNFGSNQEEHF